MAYNHTFVEDQFRAVHFFVRHLAYYRGLLDAKERLTHNIEFWDSTRDGHLKLAAIAWCSVFGQDSENLHWKNTPKDNLQQAQQDFRNMLFSRTGFNPQQWKAYHKDMVDFRSRFVAHFDLRTRIEPVPVPLPQFDPALHVAYAYQEWVSALDSRYSFRHPTLSFIYEQYKAEAFSLT